MFQKLVILLQMIKFSHTIFAMPFAILAAFLAGDGGNGGFCGWGKLFLIVWCMVFARSIAMTFNRIVDEKFDALNPRTADRALPAGKIKRKHAMWFLYICSFMFAIGTYLFSEPLGSWFGYGNFWPMLLSVPVLGFICMYSVTKRFTWGSHFWLGLSLMLAPVCAWIAICPPAGPVIGWPPVLLGLAVAFWTAGFDIIYACQDISIDRRDGLYSVPANLGVPLALWISRTCHSLSITFLLILPMVQPKLGNIYLTAVSVTALLLVGEHLITRQGKMAHIKIAFAVINGFISILLATAAIIDIMH